MTWSMFIDPADTQGSGRRFSPIGFCLPSVNFAIALIASSAFFNDVEEALALAAGFIFAALGALALDTALAFDGPFGGGPVRAVFALDSEFATTCASVSVLTVSVMGR